MSPAAGWWTIISKEPGRPNAAAFSAKRCPDSATRSSWGTPKTSRASSAEAPSSILEAMWLPSTRWTTRRLTDQPAQGVGRSQRPSPTPRLRPAPPAWASAIPDMGPSRASGPILPARAGCLLGLPRALRADPADLHDVVELGEPVLLAESPGQGLEVLRVELDGVTAPPADQMVVVDRRPAPPVEGLAGVATDAVDLAGTGQGPELAVHGGQADPIPGRPQPGVQVLGAGELVGLVQEGGHRPLLPGDPDPRSEEHTSELQSLR